MATTGTKQLDARTVSKLRRVNSLAVDRYGIGSSEKKNFKPRPITLAHAEKIASIKIEDK